MAAKKSGRGRGSSSHKFSRFVWTEPRQKAALEVAKKERTEDEIATLCGVTRRALFKWRLRPEFIARVEEHRTAWAERIKAEGIAHRQNRIDALNRRWHDMQTVFQERGEAPEMQSVPGGKTGLMCRQVKGIGKGDDFEVIEIFAVDTGTLKELRDHERQAAEELGQWTSKTDLLSGGKPLHIVLGGSATPDDL